MRMWRNVAALVLETSDENRAGSSPVIRTNKVLQFCCRMFFEILALINNSLQKNCKN